MPRTSPSPADLEMIAHAATVGLKVSAARLEHWRRVGLLPPNQRRALGRGRGSTSRPAPGAAELVVWLGHHARRGDRPARLALLAFAEGLPVPQSTVRAAFTDAARAVRLDIEAGLPANSSPDDVADAAVAAGLRGTMVPARIRQIDKALGKAGIDWAAPALGRLDPSPKPETATRQDWIYAAVKLVLEPGSVDMGSIGGLMRGIVPSGAAAPLAGLVEYRWPGTEPDLSDDVLLNEEGGMAFLPAGDLRETLADIAETAPLPELHDAWQAASDAATWAHELCDRVEDEIASGQLGQAAHEWLLGSFGPPRLLMCQALRERGATSPADTARTALMLIFNRGIIRQLRALIPHGHFELLENPLVLPRVLVPFMTR